MTSPMTTLSLGQYAPLLFRSSVAQHSTLPHSESGVFLRRDLRHRADYYAIHMVSAWAQHNSLVLGQVKVDNKSNEITAIPKLLSRLNIAGSVITVDAMGCQKRIAQQIIQQGGDYVLSLKGNRGNLYEDVATYFTSQLSPEAAMMTVDGGHGRIETRTICVTDSMVKRTSCLGRITKYHCGYSNKRIRK